MKLIKNSKKKTNKLLVTGFNSNDNKTTVKFLEAYGVSPATTSKNQNLTALELTKIIVDSMDGMEEGEEVSPIWHSLALDFVLGNLEYKNWYFENEDSLYLLDFWRKIDRQMTFILIYNSPENILYQHFLEQGVNASESIDSLLSKWFEYNQKLLDFFYQNQDKAILINSMAVEENHLPLLERATSKIGLKINSKKSKRAKKYNLIETESKKDPIVEHLAHKIILENPKINELYIEIQSVANIFKKIKNKKKIDLSNRDFLQYYMALKRDTDSLIKTMNEKNIQLEREKEEKEKLNSIVQNLKKKAEDTEKIKEERTQESELLLSQLHSVQEELEDYSLKNTKKDTQIKEFEKLQKVLEEEKVKLSKKVKDTSNEKEEKIQESELLLTQLHSVQEELEKYYLESQNLKKKIKEKKRYYGAAERVKSEFTYRLGIKITENLKSIGGVVTLPFALLSVRKEYKKDILKQEEKKLPPIETYVDSYDAQRVKKHLTYALGQTTIKTMKNPFAIFVLPFALISTRKKWKESREA